MPSPLHPAIVHFPIVFAVLLPFVALIAVGLIVRGRNPRAVWVVPVAFAGLLAASAFVALQTGQQEEERVEHVVAENTLQAHEEAAEQFLIAAVVLFVIALAGLLRGVTGNVARLLATAGTLVLLLLGVRVGQAGGALVYRHGAANAYVSANAGGAGDQGEGGATEKAGGTRDDD